MRRTLPLVLAFTGGIIMIIQYFIPHPLSTKFYNVVLDWLIIIGIFFYILSLRSFVMYHTNKIRRKREGWWASIVAIIAFLFMAILGIVTKKGYLFNQMYVYVYAQLQATMFSLLAFYMASAAFRAFRARNLEATLLLIAATIVMLGRVSVAPYIYSKLPDFVEWILNYPNMAAQRGIRIGVGLGMIATSLKIILGIERTYLGGGD